MFPNVMISPFRFLLGNPAKSGKAFCVPRKIKRGKKVSQLMMLASKYGAEERKKVWIRDNNYVYAFFLSLQAWA